MHTFVSFALFSLSLPVFSLLPPSSIKWHPTLFHPCFDLTTLTMIALVVVEVKVMSYSLKSKNLSILFTRSLIEQSAPLLALTSCRGEH